jgi:hypothetical protein
LIHSSELRSHDTPHGSRTILHHIDRG